MHFCSLFLSGYWHFHLSGGGFIRDGRHGGGAVRGVATACLQYNKYHETQQRDRCIQHPLNTPSVISRWQLISGCVFRWCCALKHLIWIIMLTGGRSSGWWPQRPHQLCRKDGCLLKNRPAGSHSVKVSWHSSLLFGLLTWREVNAAIMNQTMRTEDQATANAPLWFWILVQSMEAWCSRQHWYQPSCVPEDVGGPVGCSWCHRSDIWLILSPDDVVIIYSRWDTHTLPVLVKASTSA